MKRNQAQQNSQSLSFDTTGKRNEKNEGSRKNEIRINSSLSKWLS